MEIDYIREFITLAQVQNYMAAAEESYISQPSLTKHIKAIEMELGVSLFDRTTRKVHLNQFGRTFLPYAERIVSAHREARSALSKMSRDVSSTVNLGVLPSFIAYGLLNCLDSFKRRFPDYSVTLTEASNDELFSYLTEGRCNVVFVRHFEENLDPQFAVLPYMRDALVLVVSAGHPLDDGRSSVRVEELEGVELMTSTSSNEARLLAKLSQKTGVRFHISNRISRSESIISLLKRDIGAAFLMRVPTDCFYGDIIGSSIKVLNVEPEVSNMVSMVYMKDRPLNPALRSFIDIVSSHLSEQKAKKE